MAEPHDEEARVNFKVITDKKQIVATLAIYRVPQRVMKLDPTSKRFVFSTPNWRQNIRVDQEFPWGIEVDPHGAEAELSGTGVLTVKFPITSFPEKAKSHQRKISEGVREEKNLRFTAKNGVRTTRTVSAKKLKAQARRQKKRLRERPDLPPDETTGAVDMPSLKVEPNANKKVIKTFLNDKAKALNLINEAALHAEEKVAKNQYKMTELDMLRELRHWKKVEKKENTKKRENAQLREIVERKRQRIEDMSAAAGVDTNSAPTTQQPPAKKKKLNKTGANRKSNQLPLPPLAPGESAEKRSGKQVSFGFSKVAEFGDGPKSKKEKRKLAKEKKKASM
eukprot:TRINITY_DN76332_c0_g1_i1.p1 TRINITY_DN76332_c0_g1~~TRINITY_DN76332_c0_g1_i1.p1  ORF type:complete len:337 (+),score=51.80 TRINITY_DN76332_c0_g1_i1:18-1028(+)